ncbi:hypothetical protein CGI36_22170, partial [Vibrio parahaemolyticus]
KHVLLDPCCWFQKIKDVHLLNILHVGANYRRSSKAYLALFFAFLATLVSFSKLMQSHIFNKVLLNKEK